MLQQHLYYLRRAINYASSTNNGQLITEMVGRIRGAKTPVYQMIRDIVCDARFYSVVENEDSWRNYSLSVVSDFIDSLTDEDWSDEDMRTGKKEDFLNDWLTRHIFNTTGGFLHLNPGGDIFVGISDYTPFEDSPNDMTNASDEISDSLPDELKSLTADGLGIMPGMESNGQIKDMEFLYHLDPTLVELAEKNRKERRFVARAIREVQTCFEKRHQRRDCGRRSEFLTPLRIGTARREGNRKYFLSEICRKAPATFFFCIAIIR